MNARSKFFLFLTIRKIIVIHIQLFCFGAWTVCHREIVLFLYEATVYKILSFR